MDATSISRRLLSVNQGNAAIPFQVRFHTKNKQTQLQSAGGCFPSTPQNRTQEEVRTPVFRSLFVLVGLFRPRGPMRGPRGPKRPPRVIFYRVLKGLGMILYCFCFDFTQFVYDFMQFSYDFIWFVNDFIQFLFDFIQFLYNFMWFLSDFILFLFDFIWVWICFYMVFI